MKWLKEWYSPVRRYPFVASRRVGIFCALWNVGHKYELGGNFDGISIRLVSDGIPTEVLGDLESSLR
ncbi:MAG: hypothetical protein CM1200mP9_00040 [Gammaproteobacteria bacterium]|nr:MAG: hypothetical protein CM1200mP9_00040 [Gammaproteobacteria bacterium]